MNTPIILGIDPGATGALAALDAATGDLIWVEDMPMLGDGLVSGPAIADLLVNEIVVSAWVEKVHSMPGQGVATTFRFGSAYGGIVAALGALRVPVELVTPNTWKSGTGIGSDKGKSRALATRLWPAHSTSFTRKKDDGRAEAALIARHGRMTRLGAAA